MIDMFGNSLTITRGNRHASRAETLILGGFAGLFGENGVVFLRMMRWISFRR